MKQNPFKKFFPAVLASLAVFMAAGGVVYAVNFPPVGTLGQPLIQYLLRPTSERDIPATTSDTDLVFDYSAADDNVTLRADEARELLKTCADEEVIKYRAGSWQCSPDNDTVTTTLPWESITGKPSPIVTTEVDPIASVKIGTLDPGQWCSELSGKITCTQNTPLTSFTEVDPTVVSSVKDGVTWAEVTGKPSVVSSESDPVALAKIGTLTTGKWCSELSGKITCTQNTPLTSFTEVDPTVVSSVKDGVTWAEVTGKPAGFADGTDDVATLTANSVLSSHIQDGTIQGVDLATNTITARELKFHFAEGQDTISLQASSAVYEVAADCGGTSVAVSGSCSDNLGGGSSYTRESFNDGKFWRCRILLPADSAGIHSTVITAGAFCLDN